MRKSRRVSKRNSLAVTNEDNARVLCPKMHFFPDHVQLAAQSSFPGRCAGKCSSAHLHAKISLPRLTLPGTTNMGTANIIPSSSQAVEIETFALSAVGPRSPGAAVSHFG